MKKLILWLKCKLMREITRLCDLKLNNQEWATSQKDINDIIEIRNAMKRRINAHDNCLRSMAEGARCQCGDHK